MPSKSKAIRKCSILKSHAGYGGSAVKTFALLKQGKTDYKHSGRLGFPEGSFANGGAMRIAPVGLAYR